MALLSKSFNLVASLHAQILASKGTVTSCEVMALSESMTFRNALAPWLVRPATVVVGLVRVLPNFFATVDELDLLLFDYQHNAVRVLRDGIDLLNFQISHGHCVNESVDVLVGCVGLVCGLKVCLPAIAGHLPTDIPHVTFYERELSRLSLRWPNLIWDVGGQRIKLWGQTMLLLLPALSQSFESLLGRKPP